MVLQTWGRNDFSLKEVGCDCDGVCKRILQVDTIVYTRTFICLHFVRLRRDNGSLIAYGDEKLADDSEDGINSSGIFRTQ